MSKKPKPQIFVKLLPGALERFNLTMTELRVLVQIAYYSLNHTNNFVRQYDQAERADSLAVSYQHYRDLLSGLRKKGAIIVKANREYINPDLLFRGSEAFRQRSLAILNDQKSTPTVAKRIETSMPSRTFPKSVALGKSRTGAESKNGKKSSSRDFVSQPKLKDPFGAKLDRYPGKTTGLDEGEIMKLNYIYSEGGAQSNFGYTNPDKVFFSLVEKGYIKDHGEGVFSLVIIKKAATA